MVVLKRLMSRFKSLTLTSRPKEPEFGARQQIAEATVRRESFRPRYRRR